MDKEGRLVSFAAMGHGREIGAVCFQKKPVHRRLPDNFLQHFGPVKSNDAGHGKIKSQIEALPGHGPVAGKTVKDTRADAGGFYHSQRLFVRFAIVNDDRQAQLPGQIQLPGKHLRLLFTRGKITEIIKSDFSVSDNLRVLRKLFQLVERRVVRRGRIMGMDADGRINVFMTAGNRQRFAAQSRIGPHRDDAVNPRRPGAFNHVGSIGIELLHLQVGMGIDQHEGFSPG